MAGHITALLIAVGAAAVGIWVHVRFPSLAPAEFKRGLVHMAASTLLAGLVVAPGVALAAEVAAPAGTLIGVFGIAFPVLAYCLLAAFWMLRLATGMLSVR